MTARGFTLLELIIVIVIMGAMAGLAFPRIGDAVTQQSVRSARAGMISFVAKARGTAIQRGSTVRLIVSSNRVFVQAAHPVTNALQTVGVMEDFNARWGVTVDPTNDTLVYDARGIGLEASETVYTVSRGAFASRIVISVVGRVIQ
ncbi:MAG TPA: GspH/FimT family pseudopilin [Gemmatimonadales bacterium]